MATDNSFTEMRPAFKYKNPGRIFCITMLLLATVAFSSESTASPRVIVSTDIGGTDPDDFQSLIHYVMYSDRFETEGLISSPYGEGRKEDILHILDLYEKDFPKLKAHSAHFPLASELREVTKQGATDRAPAKGWTLPSEGSEWIINCARRKDPRPLWLLVWGGLEDVAQALHDAPEITEKLRVYWIAGPNKKWSANAYYYLAQNFPDLWIIENNSTYRGWFIDNDPEGDLGNHHFFKHYIQGHGALGKDFENYYDGVIKMGDTPSVAYLLEGTPEDPQAPGWGGSFVRLPHGSRRIFTEQTTAADRVPVFALVEWVLKGEDQGIPPGKPCLWLEIEGQKFEGYHQGEGQYRVRFVPKKAGRWDYTISSPVAGLNGLEGSFTSAGLWPGKFQKNDIAPLSGWWSDSKDPELYCGPHQGAKTVARFRQAFLLDWAKRWAWL